MNVLRLPFYLILTMLLTSCTSLPIGTSSTITDGHVAKCNEIANEVISLDKTFKPRRNFITKELKVEAIEFKGDILHCSVEGTPKNHYVIAYKSSINQYQSMMVDNSVNIVPALYQLDRSLVKVNSTCNNDITYKVEGDYVACIKDPSRRPSAKKTMTLHVLDSQEKYQMTYMVDHDNRIDDESILKDLYQLMDSDRKKLKYDKCTANPKCKKDREDAAIKAKQEYSRQRTADKSSCKVIANDMMSKYASLSAPEILHAVSRGPYIVCVVKFLNSSLAGDHGKVIQITGNLQNGSYEFQ